MRRRVLLRLAAWPILLLTSSVPAQQLPSLQGSSGRDCASCHLPWVESFKRPDAILLIARPPESYVSESDNCLGCHDGAVGDARRRVWVEHGHKTGVAPPETMKIPPELPLRDGKLACRTCHTAHSGTGPETLATTVFLRAANDAGQLCVMCHSEYVKGPAQGSHPLGEMKIALPEVLKKAYALAGKDNHTLNCRSCHTPHGQREEHLLVLEASNRALCLSCHQELTPELWKEGRHHPHPQDAKLVSDDQRGAIREMHTRTGANETLICLSCHKMHTAVPGTPILADTMENSALCMRCHSDKKQVLGTPHDLRQSAPEAVNLRKQTAAASGPCGACHGVHEASRTPSPSEPDPSGQCLMCHGPGEMAQKHKAVPVSHPTDPGGHQFPQNLPLKLMPGFPDPAKKTIACQTCHTPHDNANTHFFRAKHDALCSSCHGEQAGMAGGAHDFTLHTTLKNARGETARESGACGFCHGVHDAKGPRLWVATPQAPESANDLCAACHRSDGMASRRVPGDLRHPAGSATVAAMKTMSANLPLFDAGGRRSDQGGVACATCHNTHSSQHRGSQLRGTAQGQPAATVCITCHQDVRSLARSLHAPELLQRYLERDEESQPGACAPCHATHARPGMAATGMWCGPVAPDQLGVTARCLGCHSKDGGGPAMTPTVHPTVLMQNIVAPGQPGYLPLFDESGHEAPTGQISCRTCHLPHGREDVAHLAEMLKLDYDGLRAALPMVRSYVAPNVCSTCHGLDGINRFLYFHMPEKR